MKKIISLFLGFLLLFSFNVSARVTYEEEPDLTPLEILPASAEGDVLDIKAKSYILMEPKSGKILYEKDSDSKCAPASITKIMSLILIMEAIEKGQFNFDTVLSCSSTAAHMGGSQIWLEEGEQMSVHELLKAVTVVSANDATVLLAEAVAGSEETFVFMMNEKAKMLGMNSTNFENATGLDSSNHYTTAHDIALMSAELLKHEKITEYSTIWMDSLRNGESELVNTNKLVRFYEGCTGLKTGTTSTAGYCLSASAKRKGLNLVAVIMNGETSALRFSGAQKLLNYGFANYKIKNVETALPENTMVKTLNSDKKQIPLTAENSFPLLIKNTDSSKITTELILPESITAPVKEGDKVGEVKIYLDGEEIGSVEVKAAQNADKLTLWRSFLLLLNQLFAL